MSSYSFQGRKRVWTPRDEEENQAVFSTCRQETGISMPKEFKPVYYAHAEYEVEKWSVKRLIRLLRLYGAHRCLWDVRDPDNRNRKMRKAALVDITAAMGEDVTRAQILQKINVLRATYRYEKRRIKQRIRKGIGARTKLKWFALADAFLRHVPRAEKFRKNENADSDTDLENTMVFTIDPETLVPLEDDEESVEHVVEQIKQEELDYTSSGSPSVEMSVVKQEYSTEVQLSTKSTWTTQHSMQFVQLLRAHSTLWSTDTLANRSAANDEALQAIADEMNLPVQRIRKRVHTFRRTCENEFARIEKDSSYKPDIVWWSLAVSFMKNNNSSIEVEQDDVSHVHFVDANAIPPATPLNIAEMRAKSDLESESANVEIVNKEHQQDQHQQQQQQSNHGNTKLIWNGLEDDLLEGKWSLKHSVKFLRLYGAHRCLWDLTDVDYRSREMRSAAIEDIAAAMGYGLNANYVAKKIKIFRITYMQHRKRMLEAIKQGKQPEIQLRWFPLADSFLRPHIGLRCIKAHEREMPQFDFQYVYANLNLIDPALLTDFRGKGTQNTIEIGAAAETEQTTEMDEEKES